ncbi:13308_t:CDS:2 [Funneliformis geosporum]|uniref:5495_t:CDS:1 n=1 Tax=Funneliformis geosporum TaxID=1117311 RepID=A0A9W4SYG9_9GLOM|nr:13308_t:CDS:2 [Funneliformis geosporum]CAI2186146.1 5495_t:CDS:2 [Funneliformis geosporum]
MGAKQSSFETPIIIYNDPNIRFSHGLVDQLQLEKERMKNAKNESTYPSDIPPIPPAGGHLLPEELENIIKVRVDNELNRLRERDDEIAQRAQEELNRQRVILGDSGANSVATELDTNALIDRIQRKYENKVSSEVIEQQRAVISCYQNNSSRTLDCWEEVQKFKRVTQEAIQEFVTSHQ